MKPILLVLAAGMGSRYGGIKQIEAVGKNDECLLDFATFDAKRAGFGKVVYVIRKDIEKDFRERLFDRVARNFNASYAFQSGDLLLTAEQLKAAKDRKKPWGTVHAVLSAKKELDAPFTVINADDYYGRNAFETISGYLSNLSNTSTEHSMVGYVLENTMSKSGTVSRGVCTVKEGYLASVDEQTKIGFEGEKIVSEVGGGKITLTGKEWVSMNFFGYSPTILDYFSSYFEEFIKANAASEKAECLLPIGTNELLKEGKGRVKFFESTEKWFGMTYPEDRALVKEEIAKKVAEGYYPAKLWE